MEPNDYLDEVLKSQNLADESEQSKTLQEHRKKVEGILRTGFPECSPTIQYGGSKAKGTLNKESYDLDIVCYFPFDVTSCGDTLKDIFNNTAKILGEQYYVELKTSAIRLRDKQNKLDAHIDVVPGRYVDETKSDCFIFQNGADKCRLKTNISVHIDHVKNSGVVPAIRLLKLWKTRRGLGLKQFIFELLVIELLKGKKDSSLDAQLTHVWTSLAESEDFICVQDPANPNGNDFTEILKNAWWELSNRSRDTLALLEASGWEAVFGKLEDETKATTKTINLVRAASTVVGPTRPWSGK